MNPITWVQGLQGVTLIAVLCGLLFFEEVGVPILFAPGDLVLGIAGIAIAGGRVNAIAMVGAAAVSSLAGALIGRELFALLGWARLMRVAEPLRMRRPLEQASSMLQRGGWRAVFTARLIPGLRVHTTEVAGVSRMRRGSFVAGLLPATAVYLAAFIGLGAAFGKPILSLVHEAENQAALAIVLIVGLIMLIVLTRAPLRRGLASLQAAGWTGPLRFSLDAVGLSLVLGALGLDFAGHAIAQTLGLPLFLDSIGTVLAGVIAGPWVGASVGLISNLVSANTVDPIAAPYALVSFMVGFAAGLSRYLNWQKRASGWLSLWLVCAAIAALVSTPLNFLMSGGNSGVPFGDALYQALLGLHVPRVLASLLGEAAIDLPDKLLTVVAALLIAQSFGEQRVTSARRTELDLRQAFTFVVHSERWLRRLLLAAACLASSVLIVPFFLHAGYVLQVAREARAGRPQLPPWNQLGRKMLDGVKVIVILLIWALPGAVLSIPAAVVSAAEEQPQLHLPAGVTAITGIIAGVGSVWILVLLLLEAPILSEYLDRGFLAAISPWGVINRLRSHVALSVVVGALVIGLTVVGLIGLVGLLVGVLVTLPYASFVGAYLVGFYAQQTAAMTPSRTPATLPPPGLAAETRGS